MDDSDLPTIDIDPQRGFIEILGEGLCLYKEKRLSGSQDSYMERQCGWCRFRQPGEKKLTVAGKPHIVRWTAGCPDAKD